MDQKLCDERHERVDARLRGLEKSVKDFGDVVIAIKELAIETKYMREDMNEAVVRIQKLESKDVNKWEKFKWIIVAAIVTGVAGLIFGYLSILAGIK